MSKDSAEHFASQEERPGERASGQPDLAREADGEAAGPDLDAEKLRARLRELEEENGALKDQYLRKAADFENYRKRSVKEREESLRYANASLLQDLIPIIDNFERAISSSAESKDFDNFHTGVGLIEKQLSEMLDRKYGLRRFESAGEVFDPTRHEAISVAQIEPPADARIVVEDFQKGFMLHDRILRPARVKVSLEPAPQAAAQEESGSMTAPSDFSSEKEGDQ